MEELNISPEQESALAKSRANAVSRVISQVGSVDSPISRHLSAFYTAAANPSMKETLKKSIGPWAEDQTREMNLRAKAFRDKSRLLLNQDFPSTREVMKGKPLAKANLDVGTITNFSQITGGQSLGYVSLDTRMARQTVRPDSFTLYQCLNKSMAYQVVDYWSIAKATGGALPGSAFGNYSSVNSGTLNTSAGIYDLNNITLKLALDGRAITVALAAQNSYVDIVDQENANAALTVLKSINWANYWGNPTLYDAQFTGIANAIPTANIYDFQQYATAQSASGLSNQQLLFNFIYEIAAKIVSFDNYGHITHAFMPPSMAGDLQSLITTLLNNLTTPQFGQGPTHGVMVNGDLVGMNTRFGTVQFPVDLFIEARDIPAQGIITNTTSNTNAALTTITAPASVTVAASTGTVSGSDWTADYVASSGVYMYAVAGTDVGMNESLLTFSAVASGIPSGGAYTLTITPGASSNAGAFRIFRSGLGYNNTATPSAQAFRYIGDVIAPTSGAATFVDLNTHIPGSASTFLLDLDERDDALDYRYLLPLTRVELFAQNLYMPWAVCAIGSIRVKIPRFHSLIKNYVPNRPDFNPLKPNL